VEQRISFLKKAMGNPVMSYTSGYPSVEDRYEVAIGAYLSGVWKRDYSSFSAMEKKMPPKDNDIDFDYLFQKLNIQDDKEKGFTRVEILGFEKFYERVRKQPILKG